MSGSPETLSFPSIIGRYSGSFRPAHNRGESGIEKAGQTVFAPQIIEDPGDLEGWSEVNAEDRKTVLSLIEQHQEVLFFDFLTVLADKYSHVLFSCSLKDLSST